MKIGFGVPVSGSWATRTNMIRVARRSEELGYYSLWTFQRLLSPVDGSWGQQYRSVHDPLVPLAFLAALTDRVRLGVAVLNLPFIAPPVLAKALTSLDILSDGRLDAGLGLGWSDDEFVAVGVGKAARGRRAEEYVHLLRTLWTDDVVEHAGEFYRVPRMAVDPKPVQRPGPPILLGGFAPAALRRAGRVADGWISGSQADLAAIGAAVSTITDAATAAGRDPRALRFVCRAAVKVRPSGTAASAPANPTQTSGRIPKAGGQRDRPGSVARGYDPGQRRPLSGTVDEIRADLAVLAGLGITETFVDLNFDPEIGSPDADPVASMRRAEEALEAFAPPA